MTTDSLFALIIVLTGLIVWMIVTSIKMGQIDSRVDLRGRWANHQRSKGPRNRP
jgi:hypothetical protein